jgi:hypothetical protein
MLTSTKTSLKKTGDKSRINFTGAINSNPAEYTNPGTIIVTRKPYAI